MFTCRVTTMLGFHDKRDLKLPSPNYKRLANYNSLRTKGTSKQPSKKRCEVFLWSRSKSPCTQRRLVNSKNTDAGRSILNEPAWPVHHAMIIKNCRIASIIVFLFSGTGDISFANIYINSDVYRVLLLILLLFPSDLLWKYNEPNWL